MTITTKPLATEASTHDRQELLAESRARAGTCCRKFREFALDSSDTRMTLHHPAQSPTTGSPHAGELLSPQILSPRARNPKGISQKPSPQPKTCQTTLSNSKASTVRSKEPAEAEVRGLDAVSPATGP